MAQLKGTTLVLLFWLLLFCTTVTIAEEDNGAYMSKLFKAISPTPSGWSNSTLFCSWNGVKCDHNNRVTTINLSARGLTGTLPSGLNTLSQLTQLDLSLNSLAGPFPSLANLTFLQIVYFQENKFTSIPDGCFKGLTNLQMLSMSNNFNLSPWTFPTYMADSTKLFYLDLESTNLQGTLPNIFNSFHRLREVDLSYNNITGVLPYSLLQSPIEGLRLDNQNVGLSGSIGLLSEMIHMVEVRLDHNMFTGPIPDLSNCSSLFILRLHDNLLSGTVPSSLAAPLNLKQLSLEKNLLRGPFPEFKNNDMGITLFPINRLCPNSLDGICDLMVLLDIAEAYGNPLHLINTWKWNTSCRNWSFIECDQGMNVYSVNLARQGLKGTFSPEFAKLLNLVSLDLSGNDLSGSIPNSLGALPQLKTLDLSYNNLSGMVPQFQPSVKLYTTGNILLQSSKGNGPSTISTRNTPSKIAGGWFAGALASTVGVVLFVVIICNRKRCLRLIQKRILKNKFLDHSVEEFIKKYRSSMPKQYSYSEVKKLTKSFQHKLGQGGFGVVYKASLPDGRHAAVKVISESKGSGEEFINEVASISKTSHVNIVSLLGFCYELNKRALIYEFMPNGSLDKFIRKRESPNANCDLDWKILYKITIGIAQGLAYLHRGCGTKILHLDIKPQNILLDEDFCPKISDFGLAKICKKKESIVSLLGTRGTIGYIAPEVLSRTYGGVSHKADAYSYGMLVLDMIGVRKNRNPRESQTDSEVYFPDWIYKDLEEDNINSICKDITDEENKMVRKMIIVGLWCIQTNPIERPSMNKVVEMLEDPIQSIPFPRKPASPNRAPLQLQEIPSSSMYATNSTTVGDVSSSQMSSRKPKSCRGQDKSIGDDMEETQGIDEENSLVI